MCGIISYIRKRGEGEMEKTFIEVLKENRKRAVEGIMKISNMQFDVYSVQTLTNYYAERAKLQGEKETLDFVITALEIEEKKRNEGK